MSWKCCRFSLHVSNILGLLFQYIYIYICMYTHKYVSFLGGLEQNLKSLKRRYSIQPFVCNVGDIYLRP